MAELRNCPMCDEFFNYTGLREVCHNCAQKEEDMYQVVYRFLRKRENRAANVERIEEATGVDRDLLYKWVRKGRLHPAIFPSLGYPCDNCGRLTTKGKLCEKCAKGAVVKNGLAIIGSQAAESGKKVEKWLRENGLS